MSVFLYANLSSYKFQVKYNCDNDDILKYITKKIYNLKKDRHIFIHNYANHQQNLIITRHIIIIQ